ncbi:MAG: DUF2269 domain-containing protein [Sphingomicrobium sp.]
MFLLLKTVHIISVILFLGNIITGIFWMAHANRTQDPQLQAHAMAGVIRSDAYFTMPTVVLILLSGVALTMSAHLPNLGTPWIALSLLAFGISGILFGAVLAPLQRRLQNAAEAATGQAEWPSAEYRRMSIQWEVVGIIAILLPLAAVVLMVFKPADLW